jgi:hypothetical protein
MNTNTAHLFSLRAVADARRHSGKKIKNIYPIFYLINVKTDELTVSILYRITFVHSAAHNSPQSIDKETANSTIAGYATSPNAGIGAALEFDSKG